NYYRLLQADMDANSELTKVVAVFIKQSIVTELITYPNPARDQVAYRVSNAANGDYTVQLFDMFGKQVMHRVLIVKENILTGKLMVTGLPEGVYLLTISGQHTNLVQQIIKQ